MNIFVLDRDIKKCVKYHCNRHVVKMILEYNQILSSVHWMTHEDFNPNKIYKLTHKNHPCCIWARESLDNYKWLLNLTKHLLSEYTYRYGKQHASFIKYQYLSKNLPPISSIGLTEFKQCMPDQYKNINPVQAYRDYYMGDKRHIAQWKKRKIPFWWK